MFVLQLFLVIYILYICGVCDDCDDNLSQEQINREVEINTRLNRMHDEQERHDEHYRRQNEQNQAFLDSL